MGGASQFWAVILDNLVITEPLGASRCLPLFNILWQKFTLLNKIKIECFVQQLPRLLWAYKNVLNSWLGFREYKTPPACKGVCLIIRTCCYDDQAFYLFKVSHHLPWIAQVALPCSSKSSVRSTCQKTPSCSGFRYPGFLIEWIFCWIELSQIEIFKSIFELNFPGKSYWIIFLNCIFLKNLILNNPLN